MGAFLLDRGVAVEVDEDAGPLLLLLLELFPEKGDGVDDDDDDDGWPCWGDAAVSEAPPDFRVLWRCFMASLNSINDALKD